MVLALNSEESYTAFIVTYCFDLCYYYQRSDEVKVCKYIEFSLTRSDASKDKDDVYSTLKHARTELHIVLSAYAMNLSGTLLTLLGYITIFM